MRPKSLFQFCAQPNHSFLKFSHSDPRACFTGYPIQYLKTFGATGIEIKLKFVFEFCRQPSLRSRHSESFLGNQFLQSADQRCSESSLGVQFLLQTRGVLKDFRWSISSADQRHSESFLGDQFLQSADQRCSESSLGVQFLLQTGGVLKDFRWSISSADQRHFKSFLGDQFLLQIREQKEMEHERSKWEQAYT